jgi:hypothetical protein
MTTLRTGIVVLLAAQPLLLSSIVLWPIIRHPPYIRDAYRARSIPPTEIEIAVVQAAWDRKRREDRHFIIGGLCLMAILAVPLAACIAKAGGLSAALWRTPDQPPPS